MTDSEILEIIRRLDSQFSKEGAEAELSSFGEVALYANRDKFITDTQSFYTNPPKSITIPTHEKQNPQACQ